MVKTRRIGTIGTASRVLVGLALLVLAFTNKSWGLEWYDFALGLVGFPAVMAAVGLVARYKGRTLRLTGPVGLAVNAVVLTVLFFNEYTVTATALFIGVTLLVAAWRAQPGCEATVLSNWILRRDDQVGCPTFTPIDAAEARLTGRNRQPETTTHSGAA